ncbi:hypothetical protein SeMB42_g01620 [Synchytrium endobioticum]|uniref:60S ribosomal export protein NMD3 n=1 Tax=Synchytrium endobioticum TaxID=286115 RepID=A0A507DLN6_9FUNG|nr:hypothetical protein SeMB42_g01620 [Synchytrium endobioticum]
MAMEYTPVHTEQRILCASCGSVIAPNQANLCVNCIRNSVDVSDGIPKQAIIHFCRNCDRYQQPPSGWIQAELESRELLALCLKKLKGLSKVRLVDAGFIWTEPHSRRIKLKLTIQKEVFASTILQQVFVVEFTVIATQCEECTRVAAQLTWKAVVQVRQKVNHKRTFLYLEQLILKHNAHNHATNIKEIKDGLDFFYGKREHALKMVEFLNAVIPVKLKQSEELISSDKKSNVANFKYSYSVEIVPVCRDDLICLPLKTARSLSDISSLVLCHRVGSNINLLDPNTLKIVEVRTAQFWDSPFSSLCDVKDLVEFYIIDIQQESASRGKYALATVEVAPSHDLSTTYVVRTHLGNVLRAGDHALGYHLTNANFNNSNWDDLLARRIQIPDVVLVRKSYPARKRARSTNKSRNWKLKSLNKVVDDGKPGGKSDKARADDDYEIFLRDLEEDAELRGMVNLYKAPVKITPSPKKTRPSTDMETDDVAPLTATTTTTQQPTGAYAEEEMDYTDGEDSELPEISINELLDDMEGMTLADAEGNDAKLVESGDTAEDYELDAAMAIKRKVSMDEVPLTLTQSRTKRKIHHQAQPSSMALPVWSGADDDHYSSEDDGDYAPPDAAPDNDDDALDGSSDEGATSSEDPSSDEDYEDRGPQREPSPLLVNPQQQPLKGMSLDFAIFSDQFNGHYEGRQEVIRTARTRAQAQALRVEMLTARSTELRRQITLKNRELRGRRDEVQHLRAQLAARRAMATFS